ncbi:hypothetical protein [Arthrobacter sp. B10-11]|uniref:hypothetical protein n=1 Tax=Arthrobacter sp. B10-11 TaxID=3081160 RepID=UPI0029552030|nr:hypothetical protein [Arthrobacter sp. B10-11]MDV8148543.1 hypothetical protein [Arthrobacter sp. B10-11]
MSDQSEFLRKLFANPEEERITLATPTTPPAPDKDTESAARTFARELFARSSED